MDSFMIPMQSSEGMCGTSAYGSKPQTMRQQLEQKQKAYTAQLEAVTAAIKALDENTNLEAFMNVVQNALYR